MSCSTLQDFIFQDVFLFDTLAHEIEHKGNNFVRLQNRPGK